MQKLKSIDLKREGKQLLRDYLGLAAGTLVAAIAFSWFFLDNDIAPGGVTGIATVLARFIPLGVGLLAFLINLPLFMLGWRTVGIRFAVRSFVAMLLLSLFIDLLPRQDIAQDPMLASVFGGLLMGIGLGAVVRCGATTGGTDMAAMLVHQKISSLTIANIMLFIDSVVVIMAAAVFGLKQGLFALVSLFVASKVMDMVIKGFNTAMQFMIITKCDEEIVRRIHEQLDRGCTRLDATGTYSRMPVGTLLCVVSRMEAPQLKKIIAEIDPEAFVTVCDVHEALGEGFMGIHEQ